MINAPARRLASQLLADFLDGKITNDEYNDAFPASKTDAGLSAVYDRIWLYYSDLHSHNLGHSDLSEEDIALFRRCVEFLKTDLDYEGPSLRLRFPLSKLFRRLLGDDDEPETVLGTASREGSAFFTSHWPFASDAQYRQTLRTARSE
jgi:hypothetical protein